MSTFESMPDEHHSASGSKVPNNVDSESGLAFILVDPNVHVKDRPYQRHVRSHVMRDFQRRKEAQKGQSKHARKNKSEQQLPKVDMQLQGAVGQEGQSYQGNIPLNKLPPNIRPLDSSTSHDTYKASGPYSVAGTWNPLQPQVWSQPMTILDAGMVDPFNCLPVTLDRAQYELIDYWIFEMGPTFTIYNEAAGDNQLQAVLGYVATDEALMHSFLSTFAMYRGDLMRQGHDDDSYMRERTSAINLINSRLAHFHLAIADTTIATVAVLAANVQTSGNLYEAIIYSNGLRRIISLRGGLGALSSNSVLRTLIAWILPTTESELFQSEGKPRILTERGRMDNAEDLYPGLGTVIGDSESSALPSDQYNASFETIDGQMLSSCSYAPGTGFTAISTVCDLDAGNLRLLNTLRFLTITTESFLLLPDPGSVDLSYLSGLCKFQLPDNLLSDIRTDPHQHTQRILNRTLSYSRLYKTTMRPLRELLFWCFFLDGLKGKLEQETGASWLAPGTKAYCAVLTLQTWLGVREVLELFLWSRTKIDEDGERFVMKLWRCRISLDLVRVKFYDKLTVVIGRALNKIANLMLCDEV
ncbi:hypothetical protein MMC18_006246 [Xylographa bjoerkii]|nr:hypothetical protein [Xylographa bjoerkii]